MGRYLLIQGTLFSEFIILVNIYAPNKHEPSFFSKLFCNYSGDFNCTPNIAMDKSSHIDKSHCISLSINLKQVLLLDRKHSKPSLEAK